MKNFYDLLAEKNVTLPEDFDKDAFDKDFHANYKTVAETEKKDARIAELEKQVDTVSKSLKAFEGVNVDELNGKIAELNNKLVESEKQYNERVSAMEFNHIIDGAIGSAKGKNAKAIRALLDMDTLKASKNQTEDIKTAIEKLKEENDYLFESDNTPAPYAAGTGKGPIGQTSRFGNDKDVNAFAEAAGLKLTDE